MRVPVVVVTRPTNAYKEKDRPALEKTLASLQASGVRLIFRVNIHQKPAVNDQKIVWYEPDGPDDEIGLFSLAPITKIW